MIIVVGDTPSSIEINAGGALGTHPRWRPRSTSAPIGNVSPWGVYLYMSMIWTPGRIIANKLKEGVPCRPGVEQQCRDEIFTETVCLRPKKGC